MTWLPAEADKASFWRPQLDPCWYVCDECTVMMPSWFSLLWSFLSWGFPGCFWENHSGNKVVPMKSQCSLLHLGAGVASKAVMTLSAAPEAQAVPLLWQKPWAEPKVMEPLLHFLERVERERGRKENNVVGRVKTHKETMIRTGAWQNKQNPQTNKLILLIHTMNTKIMLDYTLHLHLLKESKYKIRNEPNNAKVNKQSEKKREKAFSNSDPI